jgi:hypothetical protein
MRDESMLVFVARHFSIELAAARVSSSKWAMADVYLARLI